MIRNKALQDKCCLDLQYNTYIFTKGLLNKWTFFIYLSVQHSLSKNASIKSVAAYSNGYITMYGMSLYMSSRKISN